MNCSTPGLPVHHQLMEFTQTHVHRVSDAIPIGTKVTVILHCWTVPADIGIYVFRFKFFIIHHGCTIWGWLNTIGFQFFFEYFPDYCMQVTMKIFGILKFWNSEQARTWRKTLSFTDIHIYNQCSSTWNFFPVKKLVTNRFAKSHSSKIGLKKCNLGYLVYS